MRPPLTGLFAPVTTPFGADGAADPIRFAGQLEIYAALPLAGIVLFGTSGEGPLLEPDEEERLLAVARPAWPADRPLVVQVGKESVRATVAAARRAAAAGADALLCLPPRYYTAGDGVVARHYRAVREAVDLPLLAYHIPHMSGVEMAAELLVGLAREGAVAGIKDSAGDLALQRALRDGAGAGFAVLNGKASTVAEALAAGADGAVLAVADVVPETVIELFEAHAAGDAERVGRLQRSLSAIGRCLGPGYGVAGIKAGIDLRGWPGGGAPRPPLEAVDLAGRREIAAAIRAAGIEP